MYFLVSLMYFLIIQSIKFAKDPHICYMRRGEMAREQESESMRMKARDFRVNVGKKSEKRHVG